MWYQASGQSRDGNIKISCGLCLTGASAAYLINSQNGIFFALSCFIAIHLIHRLSSYGWHVVGWMYVAEQGEKGKGKDRRIKTTRVVQASYNFSSHPPIARVATWTASSRDHTKTKEKEQSIQSWASHSALGCLFKVKHRRASLFLFARLLSPSHLLFLLLGADLRICSSVSSLSEDTAKYRFTQQSSSLPAIKSFQSFAMLPKQQTLKLLVRKPKSSLSKTALQRTLRRSLRT